MTDKRFEQCILATCPVPWDEKFGFAEDIFADQISHILNRGTKHIYLFGTAGEGYAVSDGQFDAITAAFASQMRDAGAKPMVGVISLSLPTVIERIERAYNMGIREFQISLPAWAECTFKEVMTFFDQTCGRFLDCSFLHYNTVHSKRLISPDEYGILAQRHQNLTATKNGAGNVAQILALARKAPQLRHFYTELNFACAAMMSLEPGFLISAASINWKRAGMFYRCALEGKSEDIKKYVYELENIISCVIKCVAPYGHIDGAYDKIFAKVSDGRFPLRLLAPYSYAGDDVFDEFVNYLRENYPLWIDNNVK